MDEKEFAKLVKSVKWMVAHQKGKARGGRITVVNGVDVKATRRKTGLSQAEFARLLQVSKGTLLTGNKAAVRPPGLRAPC